MTVTPLHTSLFVMIHKISDKTLGREVRNCLLFPLP